MITMHYPRINDSSKFGQPSTIDRQQGMNRKQVSLQENVFFHLNSHASICTDNLNEL